MEWLGDLGCNILFEDKFSAVRALQSMADELPSPPPTGLNDDDDEYVPPDFGAMGWKLGRNLVRKASYCWSPKNSRRHVEFGQIPYLLSEFPLLRLKMIGLEGGGLRLAC